MANLPGKKFLRSPEDGDGPGVLTTLLRVYIEERDRSALDTFFELLYDDHFREIALQVRGYGKASDVTVKEVIDDSLFQLLEDVLQNKYRKAPESAAEHVKYLLLRRFITRRRRAKNHEDVSDHRETIPDRAIVSPDLRVLAQDNEQVADERLESALSKLSPLHQDILRLKIKGLSYDEVGEKLGIIKQTLWKETHRALERLLLHLSQDAPTMALRLRELKDKAVGAPSKVAWPSLEEIRAALPRITERVRTVLERFHFQGVTRDTLASEFGAETLDVLLRRGYDILESRFKVSFPEAFERATS
jgi:RNA polymerase sigma factor (sigma-70 family)